jgi:hypothetical protein
MPEDTIFDPTDKGTLCPNAKPLQTKRDAFYPMNLPDFGWEITLPEEVCKHSVKLPRIEAGKAQGIIQYMGASSATFIYVLIRAILTYFIVRARIEDINAEIQASDW